MSFIDDVVKATMTVFALACLGVVAGALLGVAW